MAIKLKPGVEVGGIRGHSLCPEMLLAIMVIEGVYRTFGADLTITSIFDGKHRDNSLHYVGQAIDCRTNMFTHSTRVKLYEAIRAALPLDYDVVLEADHIHVEWDPK